MTEETKGKVAAEELEARTTRFYEAMNRTHPEWDTALIISKVNQYYFTGTMQDALLIFKRDGGRFYIVRSSAARAQMESPLQHIYAMRSYRDAAEIAGAHLGHTFIETEVVPVAMLERIKKYFTIGKIGALDGVVLTLRAVKSPYELSCLKTACAKYKILTEEIIPALLKEGISETEFCAALFEAMVNLGHQGVMRFQMFQTDLVIGQIGFGENALYPTSFDGPGGARGISPAAPVLGSRERKLRRGDLVYVDTAFGVEGYYSDKTMVYQFGGTPPEEVLRVHARCMEIERKAADMLRPGVLPSHIYKTVILDGLDAEFRKNFMAGARFLGHGVGLHVDELPVIALGFDAPLIENMAVALEPKKGVPGIGLAGVEDTWLVTADGGQCLTAGPAGIMRL